MPVHDWTRVDAGVFHDFHNVWIGALRTRLNTGILPPRYYAMCEHVAGDVIPDVLTFREQAADDDLENEERATTSAVALAPQVHTRMTLGEDAYLSRQKAVVVRRAADDQIVALIEIVSSGNKAGVKAFSKFVRKCDEALQRGYHLLLADLYPPTARDPQGIHGAIWAELEGDAYHASPAKPLTLVAYNAARPITAYVEPLGVGDALASMPLFLRGERYVNVPLEETYQEAYVGVPRRWREVLEHP